MKTKTLIKIFSNPLTAVYYLTIGVLLGFVIASVYKKTNKSLSYSHAFAKALVMLLPLVALIINIVNTNVARAIGVFGAFSVTRFRTPIKNVRDMVYIFWVLATGLTVGAGEIGMAVTETILLAVLAYLLYITDFGSNNKFDYVLIANLNTKKGKLDSLNRVIDKYSKTREIVNVQADKSGENLEITQNLKLKKKVSLERLIQEIRRLKGVNTLNISPLQNGVEF